MQSLRHVADTPPEGGQCIPRQTYIQGRPNQRHQGRTEDTF